MQFKNTILALFVASALIFAGCLDAGPEAEEAGSATMASGFNTALPFIMTDAPWESDEVTLSVVEAAGFQVTFTPLKNSAEDTLAGWVEFEAPEDHDLGDHEVVVRAEAPNAETRDFAYTITLEQPDPPIQEGQHAQVTFTQRSQEGLMMMTNDEEIADLPLPKSPQYQEPQGFEPVPLPVMNVPPEQGGLPEDFLSALLASGVGHTITVVLPPEEHPMPREEVIPTRGAVGPDYMGTQDMGVLQFPREMAEQQGMIPPGAQEGDPVDLGLPFSYTITHLNDTDVELTAGVSQGQRITLHDAWPESAQVVEVTETQILVEIDPPVEEGEPFNWVQGWGESSQITHMDEDEIIVQHSPEEGLTYTDIGPQGQEVTSTVVRVSEDHIVITQGETIYFDLTIVDVEDAPQQPPPGQPGGPQ